MFHYKIYHTHTLVNASDWESVIQGRNIYLSLEYLSALESTLKEKIEFDYILFYDHNFHPVGVGVTQTLSFIDKGFTENEQICTIRNKIKKRFVTGNGTKIITCGNPFACGENGFYFQELKNLKILMNLLIKAIREISKIHNTNVILFKEFWDQSYKKREYLKSKNFTAFEIDVNMVMNISEEWLSKEDYYKALVTKFRSKAKNAYHKSHDLEMREFNVKDIEKHKETIFELHQSVVAKSPFDFGILNSETFLELKKNLKEKFIMKGYLLKGKLVGFSSAFLFDSILDANFVGINYELNQEFAVYQRMLYDFVEFAISNQCIEIRFGRTAEEIKSSIGALPKKMILLIKHNNVFTNYLLKSIISKNKPSSYSLRRPFKSGEKK